jgi:cell division initiation protein
MKLTSQLIKKKEFKKGVRGYVQEEVDEFLKLIAEDYDDVNNELEALKQKILTLKESVEHYSEMENALQTTLVLAQDAAVQLRGKASAESDRLIREANDAVASARKEADQMIDEAMESAVSAQQEAERIIAEAQAAVESARKEAEGMLRDAGIEYTDFRTKFREFMKNQMDSFEDSDREFSKHHEEILSKPIESEKAAEPAEQADIEEAESFEDVKSFFESEITRSPKDKDEAEAPDYDDIKDFFGKEKGGPGMQKDQK